MKNKMKASFWRNYSCFICHFLYLSFNVTGTLCSALFLVLGPQLITSFSVIQTTLLSRIPCADPPSIISFSPSLMGFQFITSQLPLNRWYKSKRWAQKFGEWTGCVKWDVPRVFQKVQNLIFVQTGFSGTSLRLVILQTSSLPFFDF